MRGLVGNDTRPQTGGETLENRTRSPGALYAAVAVGRLPGAAPLRGAIYGFLVFLVAQVLVSPMMGGGVFSGGQPLVIAGSLLGHLVYGGVLGAFYGPSPTPRLA